MNFKKIIFSFTFIFAMACANTPAQAGEWSSKWENPKGFVPNMGQFSIPKSSQKAIYALDDGGAMTYFRKDGITFTYLEKSLKERDPNKVTTTEEKWRNKQEGKSRAIYKTDIKSFVWQGANSNVQIIVENETPYYFNYAIKEKDISYVKGYKKLTYKNLYPNIDVVYELHPEGGIKYSLILHPGADISVVKMSYADNVAIDNGEVHIATKFGDIIDHAPISFYSKNHTSTISSKFIQTGNTIGFELGKYDKTKTVIVDPWTQNPVLNNSRKIWETETDQNGNVYIYGGDTPIRLLKYNSTGTLQWTFTPSAPTWDSANYWIGGFITHPNGESYMTSGSNGEIRKISAAGTQIWYNNPNSLTSYEYWSLAFNCDLTRLVVGGTRLQFLAIRGAIMEINMNTGAIITTRIVGYGSTTSIPPNIQEVSSICSAPNGNYYFLTLDTVGSINTALTTINFKVLTSYTFDYYIPGYGFGTKQPISAIRANGNAVYTISGSTIHKRNLSTGAVTATAAIPGGSWTTTFFSRRVNGNGGLDIDANGNVYVGSVNQVVKYDANLNQLATYPVSFAVYDVDVNNNGEIAACGWASNTGYIQTINVSAGAQMSYVCGSTLSVTSSQTNPLCNGQCTGTATATPSGGTSPYTYIWSNSQTTQTATGLCAGSYTVTVTDATSSTSQTVITITQPTALASSVQSQTNVLCFGQCTGTATITASGGTPGYSYSWAPNTSNTVNATGLCAGTFTCFITDANGCTRTQTVTITQPASAISGNTNTTNATCGNNNGTATITANGGTGQLTYSWAPGGQTSTTATGLASGTYTVYITDANGCTFQTTATLNTTGAPTVNISSSNNPLCNGQTTGSATANATGGNGPYNYSWSNSQTTQTATGLGAGTYYYIRYRCQRMHGHTNYYHYSTNCYYS